MTDENQDWLIKSGPASTPEQPFSLSRDQWIRVFRGLSNLVLAIKKSSTSPGTNNGYYEAHAAMQDFDRIEGEVRGD